MRLCLGSFLRTPNIDLRFESSPSEPLSFVNERGREMEERVLKMLSGSDIALFYVSCICAGSRGG